jgi:lysozyme
MYITKLAFEKIKEFEGCKLQAYQDAAGVWTIGYGHTYNVRQGDKISQQYADMLLQEDIEHVERHLIALHDPEVGCWTKAQLDAVVCFAFNVGIQRWRTSTLRRYIMQGKPAQMIVEAWMSWVYAGGKQLPGLVKRREWESERFFDVSCEWDKNYE